MTHEIAKFYGVVQLEFDAGAIHEVTINKKVYPHAKEVCIGHSWVGATPVILVVKVSSAMSTAELHPG